MKLPGFCLLTCLILVVAAISSNATAATTTVAVRTVAELAAAVQQARAGTIIDIADGTYALDRPLVIAGQGTKQHPIVIRAVNLGQVRLVGTATLHLQNAAWVVVRRFVAGFVSGEMQSGETVEAVVEHEFEWRGNMIFRGQEAIDFGPGRVFSSHQWHHIDPKLVASEDRGVFRLSKASPAIGQAVGHFPGVVDDMEGQARQGSKDVGADEYHPGPAGPLRPLEPEAVGPRSGAPPALSAP